LDTSATAWPKLPFWCTSGAHLDANNTSVALFLSRMQDQCPNFAQHVFAISGVSGGSLGAALSNSLVRKHVTNAAWEPCKFGSSATGPLEQRTRSFIETDFLSPIIASAFFPDLLQRFLPFPVAGADRAEALSRGLERAWRNIEPGGENPFEQSFLNHWDPTSAAPALMLNMTEVDNGRRIVIAPFAFTPLSDAASTAEAWFYETDEMKKSLFAGGQTPPITKDVNRRRYPDQILWRFRHNQPDKRGCGQFHFMRCSAFDAHGNWQTMAVGDSHDLRSFAALGPADLRLPF